MDTIRCNSAIEIILSEGNQHIGKRFESDVIFIKAPMQPPVDDAVKHEIEEIRRVTAADREARAGQIAEVLGNAMRWHSHGRGVGIRELASEEIKLKVINFGEDEELNRNISRYYGLFVDYMARNEIDGAIHSRLGVRRFQ